MPIYAYRCKKCGSEEEHIQRMSDPPVTKCEACGGKLERLVSPAAFHLKGGGWYRDGYASTKPGAGDSGGGGDGGGSDSSSSSPSASEGSEKSSSTKTDKKEKGSKKKEPKPAKAAS
jgi:putative FmdB family regulatory protein